MKTFNAIIAKCIGTFCALFTFHSAFAVIEVNITDYLQQQKQASAKEQMNAEKTRQELYRIPPQTTGTTAEPTTEPIRIEQPTPQEKPKESTIPECDCNDRSDPANQDASNFLHDPQNTTVRTYRLKPYCKCRPATTAVQPLAPLTTTKPKESEAYQWDIRY